MAKWIRVQPKEIAELTFKSTWYYKHVPHTIEAFDYGRCKILIHKKKLTQLPKILKK